MLEKLQGTIKILRYLRVVLATIISSFLLYGCLTITLVAIVISTLPYNSYASIPEPQLRPDQKKIEPKINYIDSIQGNRQILKVGRGDTLTKMLLNTDIEPEDAINVVYELKQVYDPSKLKVGQEVEIEVFERTSKQEKYKIKLLQIILSPIETAKVYRINDSLFLAQMITEPLIDQTINASGKINSTIFATANDIGIPNSIVYDMIKVFSYEVDFQRDIHEGDSLQVLYQQPITKDGKFWGSGSIIYAKLALHGGTYSVYKFTDKEGNTEYYNEKGVSIRKSLLRTPVDGARITSGFGRRMHPVLGYNKMHRGVDFGAPRGTKIFAAGDGIVKEAGRKGTYGNYIRVMHTNGYSTAYAHLQGFAKGIKRGKRVKQGDVIGFVGTTGRSTGPHLHYEVLLNNEHINPQSIKTLSEIALTGVNAGIFKQYTREVGKLLATTPLYVKKETDVAKTSNQQVQ